MERKPGGEAAPRALVAEFADPPAAQGARSRLEAHHLRQVELLPRRESALATPAWAWGTVGAGAGGTIGFVLGAIASTLVDGDPNRASPSFSEVLLSPLLGALVVAVLGLLGGLRLRVPSLPIEPQGSPTEATTANSAVLLRVILEGSSEDQVRELLMSAGASSIASDRGDGD